MGTVFKEFCAEEISCILLFCFVCKCIFPELEREILKRSLTGFPRRRLKGFCLGLS